METTARHPRKRARTLVLAAVLVCFAELAGWWCSQDGGLVLVAKLFHHPLLFGVLVVGLLTAAVFVGVRNLAVRILTGIAAALAAFAAVPFALLASIPSETSDRTAPGRPDRHLVIEEGSAMIDPLWWVYVDEGWGPTQRRWKVGYFNGDDFTNGLHEASWVGPDRIRIVTGDPAEEAQVHLIDVDPETGRPLRTLTLG
ncbi:hypothetical protein ACF09C_25955 [Streptomyces sp. NPDC014870]|uniref:hypothetical protein n=1 Tax=Streptomyces sp. NPDC014870 TaxID=3364925 RepID=UPI0036F6D6D5